MVDHVRNILIMKSPLGGYNETEVLHQYYSNINDCFMLYFIQQWIAIIANILQSDGWIVMARNTIAKKAREEFAELYLPSKS